MNLSLSLKTLALVAFVAAATTVIVHPASHGEAAPGAVATGANIE